jgi:hypothetical protein
MGHVQPIIGDVRRSVMVASRHTFLHYAHGVRPTLFAHSNEMPMTGDFA